MKVTQRGICKLCKLDKELTYEHIPPQSAFNKNTKFYRIQSTEYFQKAKEYLSGDLKPKTRKEQGGVGDYCLCRDCNGYLGSKYVRDYKKLAEISYSVIKLYPNAKCYEYDISEINLLKFIKQIISIFICCNDINFTENYPGIIEFVVDEKSNNLPERYQLYMYLNDKGNLRSGNLNYLSEYGAICEFTFMPFGFVLNIDNPNQIMELSKITNFKNFNPSIQSTEKLITLNKYPTIYPFPLDYRSIEQIEKRNP